MTESLALADAVPQDVAPPQQIAVAQSRERDKLMADIGSGIKLTDRQKEIFRRQASIDIIDILPTGEIYVPGNWWRALLNEAFDPGGWGLRPGKAHQHLHEDEHKSVLYREVFLVVSRCEKCHKSIGECKCKTSKMRAVCLATAIGAQTFHPKNARMTVDDATEAAATNGIMRCCKPLGIYANIWDRAWAQPARDAIGIQVKTGRQGPQWRRFDRAPLYGEVGLWPGSINADKYQAPDLKPPAPRQQQSRPAPPQPSPAQDAPPPTGALLLPGHGNKTIRPVDTDAGKLWVVSTDKGEFITFNEQLMLALENYRARGWRVDITAETVTTARGPRESIFEARPLK
jgi:hypothetical protein